MIQNSGPIVGARRSTLAVPLGTASLLVTAASSAEPITVVSWGGGYGAAQIGIVNFTLILHNGS